MLNKKSMYTNNGVSIPKPIIEEIPKEISQIIYNDNKKHFFRVYKGCGIVDLITCIVYRSKEYADRHKLSARTGFDWCLKNIYKYLNHQWENKPVELDYRRVYSFFKDLLLGKYVEIAQRAIYHCNKYFEVSKDMYEMYIDTEYLSELRTELEKYDEYENEILTKTDETIRILNNQIVYNGSFNDISNLLARLRIENKCSENYVATYFYSYGVIMGKREERLRRTRGKSKCLS